MHILKVQKRSLDTDRKKSKPCICEETRKHISKRRDITRKIFSTKSEQIKEKWREEYWNKDKEMKKSVREDKRKLMADQAQEGKSAAENDREKDLYEVVKQISGQHHKKTAAVKSKSGELMERKTTEQEKGTLSSLEQS